MKIAFVINKWFPFHGGQQVYVDELANEYVKQGHQVEIFTSNLGQDKNLVYNNIIGNTHTLNPYRTIRYYNFILNLGANFIIFLSALKPLEMGEFDIVHMNSLGNLQNEIIVIYFKIKSFFTKQPCPKFVLTPHHESFMLHNNELSYKVCRYTMRLLSRLTRFCYDKVVQINKEQFKWICRNWGYKKSQLKFIPDGIDEKLIISNSLFEAFKIINLNKIRYSEHRIIYVGRLQKYKGVEKVIKVLSDLPDTVCLDVVGDGPDKVWLENKVIHECVEDRVKFHGYVSQLEKIKLICSADCLILPSRLEGFGLVLLEGMANGKPVIAASNEGTRTIIKHKENGLLYRYNNLNDLQNKLYEILFDYTKKKLYINNGYETVKKYTWRKIANQYLELYNELISDK